MELFYSKEISGDFLRLEGDEANHCARVLRHREGDVITVIDGLGTLYEAEITLAGKKEVEARILSSSPDFAAHGYDLTIACCPTKNIDRYEYFLQKATEIGADRFVPIIGEHSERKIVNGERMEAVILSAVKQSLKAKLPVLEPVVSVKDFVKNAPEGAVKLIAHCEDTERVYFVEQLRRGLASCCASSKPEIIVLIGPEGDFSPSEIEAALSAGFRPVHLGPSRLRTETAGVVAATLVYSYFVDISE